MDQKALFGLSTTWLHEVPTTSILNGLGFATILPGPSGASAAS